MSNALSLLTEAETKRCVPDPEDSGFGALRTAKGNLPLESVDVRARITGLLSHVTLVQTFQNAHAEPLEATYVFPMPDRAAVTKFTLTVGGRVVEGLLKERGAARQEYDAAIQAGHRAAIAEEERPGTFTMRVGNLMPGEKASVHLEMTSPLLYEDGEATFRFPLVVAPRYIPGVPLPGGNVGDGTVGDTDATPDASRITPPVLLPGFPNPVRLGLTVDVDAAGLTMGAIRSSLHAVAEDKKGEGLRRITLGENERLNRDFILRMAVAEKDVKTALAVTPDENGKGKGGTFALTLVPPSPATLPVKPRDVVFVLDRSGSMDGWKMVAARRAMARMIDTLTGADRFTVYAFDDSIETPDIAPNDALVEATDRNRYRAVEWIAKVESRGGTEMAQPLEQAVKQLGTGDAGRDRICVLVTDGQVGNEDQILRTLSPHLGGMRIFTVGIDRAVNEGFLKRLAAAGAGAFELVESEDRLDEAMARIHRRIGTPVLTDLTIAESGAELLKNTVVPTRMPALFAGSPLVIAGRYLGSFAGKKMKLVARDATGRAWEAEVSPSSSANPAVAVVWAREWLRELEDQYVLSHDGALEKKIVDTSLQFGVLCRFTAFVAVDRAEVVNAGGRNVKQMQPVDAPDGWAMFEEGEADDSKADKKLRSMARPGAAHAMSTLAGKVAGGGASTPAKEVVMEAELSGTAFDGAAAPEPPMDAAPLATGPLPKSTNAPARSASRGASSSAMKPPAAPKPSPAPAVPPPAKRKAPGLLGRFRGVKDEAAPAQARETIDLAPYRKRAKEILTLLEKAAPDHLLTLGAAAVQLATLVEDLESVGASAAEVAPLKALLATLREAVAKGNGKASAAHAEAVKTLRVFAEAGGGAGGATPPREEGARARSFWK